MKSFKDSLIFVFVRSWCRGAYNGSDHHARAPVSGLPDPRNPTRPNDGCLVDVLVAIQIRLCTSVEPPATAVRLTADVSSSGGGGEITPPIIGAEVHLIEQLQGIG